MLSELSRNEDEQVQERVHIAPVLFEVDRITIPMKLLRGERAHLMALKVESARVRACIDGVKAELDAMGKPYTIHLGELDLFGLISSYKRVIEAELDGGRMVYVNLSSGGPIQAIAAHYAAMEFESGVQPFFAYPERFEAALGSKNPQDSSGVAKIAMLPHFNLKMPSESRLEFLDVLGKLGEPTKGEILEECRKRGLIICSGKSRPYGHVVLEDRFIKPLSELGLIMVRRNGGKETRTCLTEKGKNTLLINGKGMRRGR